MYINKRQNTSYKLFVNDNRVMAMKLKQERPGKKSKNEEGSERCSAKQSIGGVGEGRPKRNKHTSKDSGLGLQEETSR